MTKAISQKRRLIAGAAVALAGAVAAPMVMAQATSSVSSFPNKDIRIVVPFAPGGPTEKVAKILSDHMAKHLSGAKFVVDSQPGEGGTRGTALVAKAPADGYTLLFHHIGFATAPSLYRTALGYNVLRDFDFLGLAVNAPFTIVSKPTLPAKDFEELRKILTSSTPPLRIAHAGIGSASHLCAMLFQQAIGVDLTTVPYRGTAPAMTELQAGGVDLMCDQTTNTLAPIQSNRIKAFAVTDDIRVESLPNLPTLQEMKLTGFDVTAWHGLYAPKGLPEIVAFRLNAALKGALKDPAFRALMKAEGVEIMPPARQEPAAHRRFVEGEVRKWAGVIQKAGVYAD
jgi:tripartite-type tricarboxylate transporter receptor subunit TctC